FFHYLFDLKLIRVVRHQNDSVLLQKDIDSLCRWCVENKMYLNCAKCYHIKLTRKKNKILVRTVIRGLEVQLDCQLCFNRHIDTIIAAAYGALGFVLRSSKVLEPHVDRIESVQKRLINHLAYRFGVKYTLKSYKKRLKHFKLTSYCLGLTLPL
ncbi:hypothetical protein HW555_000154, partial [Spodoptera exigua]